MQDEALHRGLSRDGSPARASRRRSDPTPCMAIPEHRGGWEYPLSREEKKHRIMYLFQAELAEAERTSTEDKEALRGYRKRERAASTGGTTTTTTTDAAAALGNDGAACRGTSKLRPELYAGAGLVVLLGILVAIWACHAQAQVPCAVGANATEDACSCGVIAGGANASEIEIELVTVNMSETVPPNISDRVLGIRSEGHVRLKLSNCNEAEWWFSTALKLLAHDGNVSDADAYHKCHIQGERGFALVCSQRFEEGVIQLEQHLLGIGVENGSPHLLNALGYAYFHTQDFVKAGDLFQLAIKLDEHNPVLWSNFAAAKMVSGAFQMADEALTVAHDSIMKINAHQEHHMTLILSNVQVLNELFQNNQSQYTPLVELWNGYLE